MKHNFLQRLFKMNRRLAKLRPDEVTIFNISGNFGQYQIRIGAYDPKLNGRPVEINGKVHHLFVNESRVESAPTAEEIRNNMKGTIIMNNITIHIFDKKGDGKEVVLGRPVHSNVESKENINLAGDNGKKILSKMEATGQLANETYRIVQEDILKNDK